MTTTFALQPAQPDRAALRAACAKSIGYTPLAAPFSPDAPADPAYGVGSDDAGDAAISVGDGVSVYPPGAWEPRHGTVEAVRDDGMYLVHMAFGTTKWCYERDVTLVVKREAMVELAQEAI